ncbi:Sec63 domain [Dillenia turbinata]|uniref:Sec63 domain n=1 Tax=Dillenia turbinata TaxID=194707 RepID=A0AAN8Z965_9MAGN
MLGSIASQYYLSYMTVSMFASNIGPDTSLEVFLHAVSGASEYDELPERYNEALSEKIPCIVEKNRLDDLREKANLLLRVELPITDYVRDLKSVLDQSIRIIQAMVDVCANSGWLSSTFACMHLLQMIIQCAKLVRISRVSLNFTWNLWVYGLMRLLPYECCLAWLVILWNHLRGGITNLQQLVDCSERDLQGIIGSSSVSRINQVY